MIRANTYMTLILYLNLLINRFAVYSIQNAANFSVSILMLATTIIQRIHGQVAQRTRMSPFSPLETPNYL